MSTRRAPVNIMRAPGNQCIGKLRYHTEESATAAVDRGRRYLRFYSCPLCGYFHLTSKKPFVAQQPVKQKPPKPLPAAKKPKPERPKITRSCPCGRKFGTREPGKKYCGPSCRVRVRRNAKRALEQKGDA